MPALKPSMDSILFIKTSSLGDVVHHMPAATDARQHFPDAQIAWVVEEAFAPLVGLHPAVDTVIPVATRRWRRQLLKRETWKEIAAFRRLLRPSAYDKVDRCAGAHPLGDHRARRARRAPRL